MLRSQAFPCHFWRSSLSNAWPPSISWKSALRARPNTSYGLFDLLIKTDHLTHRSTSVQQAVSLPHINRSFLATIVSCIILYNEAISTKYDLEWWPTTLLSTMGDQTAPLPRRPASHPEYQETSGTLLCLSCYQSWAESSCIFCRASTVPRSLILVLDLWAEFHAQGTTFRGFSKLDACLFSLLIEASHQRYVEIFS